LAQQGVIDESNQSKDGGENFLSRYKNCGETNKKLSWGKQEIRVAVQIVFTNTRGPENHKTKPQTREQKLPTVLHNLITAL